MNSSLWRFDNTSITIESLDNDNNGTTTLPVYSGFIFLFASSIFYGSNYLPVKQFETGDGMFFQLVLCIGIWLAGFVVNCARSFPKFYALPLLGGFLWSTGNNCVVPIIKTIGLGLGMIFWNCVGLVTGWATARFNFFGLKEKPPTSDGLNYAGVALTLASTIFYLFVKNDTGSVNIEQNQNLETIAKLNDPSTNNTEPNETLFKTQETDFFSRLSVNTKRIIGISLSVFSGLLYGEAFTPILYVKTNFEDASQNNLDYLFSFYTGIVITSLVYFVIYCIAKKNKPIIYNQIILPGLCSGLLWGIANVCYFLSNNVLTQAICFPIANAGPPIIANLWAVFLYKEIKGKKNLGFLVLGFAFAITGAVLTGLSF